MRFRGLALLALLVPTGIANAQCPDGSPPPCAAQPSAVHANSVAVLYFAARDTADMYRADGLTEDLATLLGRAGGVEVKSPTLVHGTSPAARSDLRAVAQALRVRWVVEGALRRAGGRNHVTARLVDARTGVTAWGDAYERADEEMLVLPSVIAREVATRVSGNAVQRSAATLRTRNADAYDHFLRGNFLLAQRGQADIAHAIREYGMATQIDPGFAAALGRSAYAHALVRMTESRLDNAGGDSVLALGLAIADRAIRLDSGSSDAWMARGFLLAFANPRTLAGSREAFERSIASDPRNAEAHHQYAQVLNFLGDHAAAERELRAALALEPQRPISYTDLGSWTFPRDYSAQLRLLDSAIALDPQLWVARYWRANARLMTGDGRGALEDGRIADELQPGNIWVGSLMGRIQARAGDTVGARARIAPWLNRPDASQSHIGLALLELHDTTAALQLIENIPPSAELWMLMLRPEFDGIRSNPRFVRALAASRPPGAVDQ